MLIESDAGDDPGFKGERVVGFNIGKHWIAHIHIVTEPADGRLKMKCKGNDELLVVLELQMQLLVDMNEEKSDHIVRIGIERVLYRFNSAILIIEQAGAEQMKRNIGNFFLRERYLPGYGAVCLHAGGLACIKTCRIKE